MRFVDVSMYSSDSENLPATTRTKRKLENEGSKGKKHSKTDIKLRVRTRRITEKEKLKYDILKLKKQLHRSKISKKKLKEKLRAVESLKIAAQNIVQGFFLTVELPHKSFVIVLPIEILGTKLLSGTVCKSKLKLNEKQTVINKK
jgi:hypothetical protein